MSVGNFELLTEAGGNLVCHSGRGFLDSFVSFVNFQGYFVVVRVLVRVVRVHFQMLLAW